MKIELKTGDIVEIKNAYFKNDNGIYFVDNAPGDSSWSGSDYSLKKMCRNGNLSTATHNIAFWPLSAFTNNKQKNADCHEWNDKNATIEVIYNIDNTQVIEHFKQKAEEMKRYIERQAWDFGENHEVTLQSIEIRNHYLSVVERLSKIKEPEQPEVEETKVEVEKTQLEIVEELQPEVAEIVRKYYPINEQFARYAKELNSFSDYKQGSATSEYECYCNKVYDILEKIKEDKPGELEHAERMADYYCRKLAEYFNDYYRNEASCPSIMISGGSNFPVRKKEKQNSRRDTLMCTWNYLQGYVRKIENVLTCTNAIKSDDKNAVQKIKYKITMLESQSEPYGNKKAEIRRLKGRLLELSPEEVKQGKEITINGQPATFENIIKIFNESIPEKSRFSDDEERYYLNISLTFSDGKRKYTGYVSNEVNKDCTLLSTYGNRENDYKTIWKPLTDEMKFNLIIGQISGSGNKAVIYSILKDLLPKKDIEAPAEDIAETEEDAPFKVVENAEIMRLQLFFDGIPEANTREVLKKHGFRWSPSNKAWQRLLNDNARYSLRQIKKELTV